MNLVFENIGEDLVFQKLDAKLMIENTAKNLAFLSLEPGLQLRNEAKNLVFDITVPVQLGFPYTFPFILS